MEKKLKKKMRPAKRDLLGRIRFEIVQIVITKDKISVCLRKKK